jgi:hypothetical protein
MYATEDYDFSLFEEMCSISSSLKYVKHDPIRVTSNAGKKAAFKSLIEFFE